jgi:hypothetical protein
LSFKYFDGLSYMGQHSPDDPSKYIILQELVLHS